MSGAYVGKRSQGYVVLKKVEPEVDKKVVRVELGGVRQDTQEKQQHNQPAARTGKKRIFLESMSFP